MPQIRLRSVHSTAYPIHYVVIILSFVPVQSELLIMSENKSEVYKYFCKINPQIPIFLNFHSGGGGWSPNWVHSARRPFIGLLYLPRVIVRMENLVDSIGRGNRSTRRKPAPTPLYPPQIPLDQTRARTRAAAVGSQRLTA
jgi:hypothetical protein